MLHMRVLITGGAGYIGSHTAKLLASAGHQVFALDNLSTGHRWAVRWGPLLEGDLADREFLSSAFRSHRFDAVIHFAALALVAESLQKPSEYFRNNVANTLNLLDCMVAHEVPFIVFSSTCATYGIPDTLPVTETHPQRPICPYGESKLCAERAFHWYGNAYSLRWASLRYFNAAGADPDGCVGEVHDNETHLIPLAIQAALGLRPHLDLFGVDHRTPDGTAVRDYIHVCDLASAHLTALAYLRNGGASSAFNLGSGRGQSVREIIRSVENITQLPVPVRECGKRPGDPPELVADAARARSVLGWHPQYCLDAIVETAYRWEQVKTLVAKA
jgi:UDP-arabinose 4-epimerase